MLNWLGGLMDRICAVIGAIIFAQAPIFMQQYTQQLVGRESELRFQVDAMRHAASLSGKTLEQLTQKFMANPDIDIVRQGEIMLSIFGRWQNLFDALTAIQSSSVWTRPFAFLYHVNGDTFSSTLSHFKMGLPLTVEGAAYALFGILIGYLTFAFFRSLWRKTSNVVRRVLKRQDSVDTHQ